MELNPLKDLNERFLLEVMDSKKYRSIVLNECIEKMANYVALDRSVAVLSDLAENKSHVFAGDFGTFFGMIPNHYSTIDSIWEEDIYRRIHPDDLFQRHLLELEFFNFLKSIETKEQLNYATSCTIRVLNCNQEYEYISHRSFYLQNSLKGGLWLDVCLYNYSFDAPPLDNKIDGKIKNIKTGTQQLVDTYSNCSDLLTSREKEILVKVGQGLISKEIASELKISINTVNRHRQNILEKLKVGNSMEAVCTAKALNIL